MPERAANRGGLPERAESGRGKTNAARRPPRRAGAGWRPWAAAALLASGCLGGAETVIVDGSNSVAPLAERVAAAFAGRHSDSRVALRSSGTSGGLRRLCDGEAHVATASRPMSEDERARCEEAGIRPLVLPVARDGVAVVANPRNTSVVCLGLAELARLWAPGSGVSTWRSLRPGLPAEAVRLYAPGPRSGTLDFFTRVVVGRAGASRTDHGSSGDHAAVARRVASHPWALGYLAHAHYAANRGALRVLQVDTGAGCVAPSPAGFADGSYSPLVRDLFLYVSEDALQRPAVHRFVAFFLSAGPDLAAATGYAPLPRAAYERSRSLLAGRARSAEASGAQGS